MTAARGAGAPWVADRLMAARNLIDSIRRRATALLSSNLFLANVLKMFAGSAAAQAVSMTLYPILTRLYSPAEMGVLSMLAASTLVLSPLVSLKLEMALPLTHDRTEAGSVLVAGMLSVIGTCTLIALILLLLPADLAVHLGAMAPYRLFLPLGLVGFGSYVIMVYEATRVEDFTAIARTRIYQALNGPASQIVLGLLGAGPLGLCIGFVFGQAAGTVGMVHKFLFGAHTPLAGVTLRSVGDAFVKYRRFALFSSWSGVLSQAGGSWMNFAFSIIYGPQIGGYMFLGERVMNRPLLLITSSVLQVFVSEFAKVKKSDPSKLRGLYLSIISKQAIMSALWIGAIVVAAPFIIPPIFGHEWVESPMYLQALAINFFPGSIAYPVMHTLQILERQRLAAVLDVTRASVLVTAIILSPMLKLGPVEAVVFSASALAVVQIISMTVTYRVVTAVSRRASLSSNPLAASPVASE